MIEKRKVAYVSDMTIFSQNLDEENADYVVKNMVDVTKKVD